MTPNYSTSVISNEAAMAAEIDEQRERIGQWSAEWSSRLQNAEAEIERLRAALALHHPALGGNVCAGDGFTWPCPTARAMEQL